MPGRRWSDGLHQAVEAKEGVQIDRETQTLATITIQNYFRLYYKLGGHDRHRRDRGERIPRHLQAGRRWSSRPTGRCIRERPQRPHLQDPAREIQRGDRGDQGRARARASRCSSAPSASRPPKCSRRMLKREKIPHTVLNAKYHLQEAEIVARAGQHGRRDDLDEHGRPRHRHQAGRRASRELGGLYVIGTERHESRRIDRQLRGRCARQGDPGRVAFLRQLRGRSDAQFRRGRPHDEDHGALRPARRARSWSTRGSTGASRPRRSASSSAITSIRKRTLEFDDVMNKQREVVYGYRNEAIDTDDPRPLIYEVIDEAIPGEGRRIPASRTTSEPNYAGLAPLGQHHLPARPDRRESRRSRQTTPEEVSRLPRSSRSRRPTS